MPMRVGMGVFGNSITRATEVPTCTCMRLCRCRRKLFMCSRMTRRHSDRNGRAPKGLEHQYGDRVSRFLGVVVPRTTGHEPRRRMHIGGARKNHVLERWESVYATSNREWKAKHFNVSKHTSGNKLQSTVLLVFGMTLSDQCTNPA